MKYRLFLSIATARVLGNTAFADTMGSVCWHTKIIDFSLVGAIGISGRHYWQCQTVLALNHLYTNGVLFNLTYIA